MKFCIQSYLNTFIGKKMKVYVFDAGNGLTISVTKPKDFIFTEYIVTIKEVEYPASDMHHYIYVTVAFENIVVEKFHSVDVEYYETFETLN